MTNLPVHAGDDVVVFMLKETPDGKVGDHCYSTNYWEPMGLYFEGKYNDYGGVEECRGVFLPLIVATIQANLFEMDVGENEYHDIAVKAENFDVDQLFEADHEGRLFVHACEFDKEHYGVDKLRLKHIVVLRSVLDKILTGYSAEGYKRNDKTGEYKTIKITFKTIKRDIQRALAAYRKADKITKMFFSIGGNGITRVLNEYASKHTEMLTAPTLQELFESDPKSAGHDELSTQIAVWYILHALMEDSRRMWCPPLGVGSQNSSTVAQRVLAKVTISEAHRIDHLWDEE